MRERGFPGLAAGIILLKQTLSSFVPLPKMTVFLAMVVNFSKKNLQNDDDVAKVVMDAARNPLKS